jgi:hypothetical protein
MRMKENDEPSLLNGFPNRLQEFIIESLTYTFGAKYETFQMWEAGNLLDCLDESGDRNVGDQRQKAKPIESLQFG